MLDWILEALAHAGFTRDRIVFVSGYQEAVIRSRYPDLNYVPNHDWAHNNILLSLLCAREFLKDGFVSTYSDIVYEPAIVERLVQSPHEITLGCDTRWLARYNKRTRHPSTDAEKMALNGEKVTSVSRRIPDEVAGGEFIGVMRLSASGAERFLSTYDDVRVTRATGPFREGRSLQKAYLIDLLQEMLERGIPMHHRDTLGGYMELDTLEDLSLAKEWYDAWP